MTKEEFGVQWLRLVRIYGENIVSNTDGTRQEYYEKFKGWSVDVFGGVIDKIVDNENISSGKPIQPSMFNRWGLVVQEERTRDGLEKSKVDIYNPGFKVSSYGSRILRFCKAVSETNPSALPDKKIRFPKDHKEIEECLLEFEARLVDVAKKPLDYIKT
jgi:hypothetical protein